MKIIFELKKEDIEHILINHFQNMGYEPDVKLKNNEASIEVECDIEKLEENF